MDFIFFCPTTRQTFESPGFEITENRGVKVDEHGNRYLDATIQLTEPCPCCGEKHAYRASELSCPF